ncbi:MAG: indole-3-glycerol phosphate synthase TrpC [Candidatus Riflebacteria bacterium]|nr:indole-3-glycerol phosphate synthase TrpC [Candidatus Riflebacteria bacterium]
MILDEILASTRRDIRERSRRRPLESGPVRQPRNALRAALSRPGVGLICEIKKASPSSGPIAPALDVAARAREYAEAGARAISVLTEPHYFSGSLADLETAGQAVQIPLLRKDFILCEYQVYETALSSAAALLLIVAALDSSTLSRLLTLADQLGLDCLVEVHTDRELDVALECGSTLIGVNNRDLSTLKVDLAVSERLIPSIRPPRIAVAESGFSTPGQIARLADLGASAFLVGGALMTHRSPGQKIAELMSLVSRRSQPTGPSSIQ